MEKNKIQKILNEEDPKEMLALFNFDLKEDNDETILFKFNIFSRFYFPQYFESPDADFHDEINRNNLKAYRGVIDSFVDVAFKGAGKDVKTKLFIAYVILNDKSHFRRYFKIISEDGKNSQQIATDIYNMLVNHRVTKLYPRTFEKTVTKREETMSRFTTSTGVKVVSDTVYTSQRGDVQEEARPDFIWFNDFETRKTLRSALTTKSIWDNMEEARTGLQKGGCCVYTCNYISELGNVDKLIKEKLSNRKIVLIIPIRRDGVPTWARYTVGEINQMEIDDDDFEGERMCKPDASKDVYFDRESLEKMPILEPLLEISGFNIYKKYNPSHRYAGGHDVAGGLGLDSSASVFIDFSTTPAQVVATYADNTILPEAFGDEIYSQANRFGGCLIAPENNKYDQTILKARQLGANIYTSVGTLLKVHVARPTTFGWNTNSLSKSTMFSDLREAVEAGLIELNDPNLINEAKAWTRNDIIDKPEDIRLITKHFDMLTACAIAWQMRTFARATQPLISVEDWKGEGEQNNAV